MKVVRAEGKSGIGDGGMTQSARNKIYDAFAAILGRERANTRENIEANKSEHSLSYEMLASKRKQS